MDEIPGVPVVGQARDGNAAIRQIKRPQRWLDYPRELPGILPQRALPPRIRYGRMPPSSRRIGYGGGGGSLLRRLV